MELKLYINEYRIGKYENNTATLEDNENLTICLNLNTKRTGLTYYAIIDKGTEQITKRVNDNVIEIPCKYLQEPCELAITIKGANSRGEIICIYSCEKLNIKRVDNQTVLVPQIEAQEQRLAKVERALKEIYEIIKNKGDLGL